MYAKCGSIEDAWRVFNKMPSRNVVTCNAMVLGHVKCGQGQKALELFQQLQQEGVQPDSLSFVGVLKACVSMVAIEEGRCVHQQIIQSGLESDVFVGSSLVDMYAKCGSMENAWGVFNKMPSQNVVTWNARLGGCAMNGHGNEALKHFEQITHCQQILELEPENAIAYVLLSNIYAAAGSRHLFENVERQRKEKGVKKQPGHTWIEVNNEVHMFVVEDHDHPQIIETRA
ncbi:unnamed protein product [Sphagnum jensenii]